MTTVKDIIRYVEGLAGHRLNADETVGHGTADRTVTGVTVCWMATPEAIRACAEQGHELLIGHESLYYPYNAPNAANLPDGWERWPVNRQRRELLSEHVLTFLRIHGSADEIAIFDAFAEMLELGQPIVEEGLVKVYEIAPCPLGTLVSRVKRQVGMDGLRISVPETYGDPMEETVHRVGLPWGGLGLFVNVEYQQRLIEQGCDVFVAGESDNYGFRFAREAGIPMIETSHEVSENPGLVVFTQMLQAKFTDVTFEFFENDTAWQMA
ncbi:MAG: Nif3-like dinuclear metal center hexameric protein [Anaerolineae bacterium]